MQGLGFGLEGSKPEREILWTAPSVLRHLRAVDCDDLFFQRLTRHMISLARVVGSWGVKQELAVLCASEPYTPHKPPWKPKGRSFQEHNSSKGPFVGRRVDIMLFGALAYTLHRYAVNVYSELEGHGSYIHIYIYAHICTNNIVPTWNPTSILLWPWYPSY